MNFAANKAPRTEGNPTAKGPKMLTLFVNKGCPFARRAMMAAREKDVAHDAITIALSGELKAYASGKYSAEMLKRNHPGKTLQDLVEDKERYKADVNPSGEVPAVQTAEGDVINEADVVAEFLDDAFPGSGVRLMPQDPVERARVRGFHKILSNSNGVSAYYGLLRNQDPARDDSFRSKVYAGLQSFVAMAADGENGPWFLGDKFSFADVMLAPFYQQFKHILRHYRKTEFIPTDHAAHPWAKRMQQWADAMDKRPSFVELAAEPEAYIRGYEGYAGERGAS